MKRSTKIITGVILSVGVVTGAVAYGKHKYGDPSARAAYMVDYISEELSLDSTQEQSLIALKDEIMSTRLSMRDQFGPMKEEVRSLISADTFDQTKALQMIDDKTAKIREVAPGVVAAMGNFLDGLSEEQKAEVVEFIDHRAKHRRHRH